MSVDSTLAPRSYRIRVVGADREIVCAPDQDILNAAIRAGVNWLKVGCRGGGCGCAG